MFTLSTRTSAEEVTLQVLVSCLCIAIRVISLPLIVSAVTASSEQPDHPAGHAVDDGPKVDTCYHSNMSSHSWWEADLGSEKFIREIVIQLKVCKCLGFC